MSRYLLLLVFVVLFQPFPAVAQGENLTIDLAKSTVDITTAFSGTNITLYGVTKRSGDVIVVVRGPKKDLKVRKKQSVFGAWINRQSVLFKSVPSFYRMVASKAPDKLIGEDLLDKHAIGLKHLKRSIKVDEHKDEEAASLFRDALIRNEKAVKLYADDLGKLTVLNDRFFKVDMYLPANVPVGIYDVETYYIENKKIIDSQVVKMHVEQTGTSQSIKLFSKNSSFVYGLGCVLLAVFSGWFSNRVRRRS